MKRPILVPFLLFCLVVAACAGGSGSRSFENPLGLRQDASGELRTTAPMHRTEVSAAPEELAEKVPEIYRYLGLEAATAGTSDPLTFFTASMRITGQLYEGEPNSAYIDCGSAIQGERADLFDVEFALATRLRPRPDGGTVVETRLEGLARDRYVNEAPVRCGGTGKLEGEIAELLRRGGIG